jgi:hypothetical protein
VPEGGKAFGVETLAIGKPEDEGEPSIVPGTLSVRGNTPWVAVGGSRQGFVVVARGTAGTGAAALTFL